MQKGHYNFLSGAQELSTIAGGTALAANGTFQGAIYNLHVGTVTLGGITTKGAPSPSIFRAVASSDVAGTLNVLQSADGTNWFVTDTAVIAAGFKTKATVIESKIVMPYVSAQIVNGAGAQTSVEFDTCFVSI